MIFNSIKRIWELLDHSEKKKGITLFVLILVGTIFEAFGIGIMLPLILSITSDASDNLAIEFAKTTLNLSDQNDVISFFVLALILASGLKFFYLSFLAWYQMSFSFGLLARISNSILKSYMRKDYIFHVVNNSSTLIRNTITEVNLLTTNAIIPSLQLITEFTVIFGIFLLLIYIEPYGAIGAVLMIITASFIFYYFTNKRILKWGTLRQKYDGKKIQRLQEGFGGIKEINLFNAQDFFINRFIKENLGFSDVSAKHGTIHQIPRLWIEMLAVSSICLLILFMSNENSDFSVIVAKLGVFAAAAIRILPSATRIISSIQLLKFSQPILDTVSSEIGSNEVFSNAVDQPMLMQDSIEFNSVCFRYNSETKNIIDAVSFRIKKGEVVGIIGQSGSGKTTLVDLLLGLIKPTEGIISVDNVDINKSLVGWQSNIGYVPQNIFLTDDTLKNNIAFGVEEQAIDLSRLAEVIKLAQLSRYVDELPNGINTIMGERGSKLSGGQRQRIGIARALYNDPDILVFDEATSALDSKTESEFLRVIKEFSDKKTILFITHKESSLKSLTDRIFKMENGKIFL